MMKQIIIEFGFISDININHLVSSVFLEKISKALIISKFLDYNHCQLETIQAMTNDLCE